MLFKYFLDIPAIIEYWGLPRGCWYCELLGICRRPKEQGWKCYNGCLVIKMKEKYEKEKEKENAKQKLL